MTDGIQPDGGIDPAAGAPAAPDGTRTRTYHWHDPMPVAEAGRRLGGVTYAEAIQQGRVPPPPIAVTLGFELAEVGPGHAAFVCVPAEYHYNPLGIVHGGLAATLIDSATGVTVQTVCPTGHGWTTLELKVNYVRAMTKDTGEVRCEGRIIHAGSRIATAEARIVDRAGKLYAHGTCTCLIFPLTRP